MTSRERVLRAIEWRRPDRVPLKHIIIPMARDRYGYEVDDLLRAHPQDFGGCGQKRLDIDRTAPGEQTDKWGCVWRNEAPGRNGYVVRSPLAVWTDKNRLRFPSPHDLFDFSRMEQAIARNAGERFLLGTAGWLWHRMFWIRGFEELLMDIAEGADEVTWLRDRVADVQNGVLQELLQFDIDGVWFYDDWGGQDTLMLRPETWRELFKATYEDMFTMVHGAGKKVFLHCCGNVLSIIPDWVEIGADVLNIQAPIMDKERIAQAIHGKAAVLGGLDFQSVLARGDLQATREHLLDLLSHFANPKGGYIGQLYADVEITIAKTRLMAETVSTYTPAV